MFVRSLLCIVIWLFYTLLVRLSVCLDHLMAYIVMHFSANVHSAFRYIISVSSILCDTLQPFAIFCVVQDCCEIRDF